ncbi:MAG TPA: hypothetical protein VJH75_03645 [Patescibacteria group bacterium]|nr:hypothetical protein [Patescibacteria group bacterium]
MSKKITKIFFIVYILGIFLFPLLVNSAMTSTNYTIFADTVGFGGDLSTSTTYFLQDTAGDTAIGASTSTSYTIKAGFQAADRGSISLTIEDASLSFGSMTTASVATVSTTVNIIAESETGYSLSVSSQSGTLWTTLTGTVDAGSEEFGVLVSGSDSAFAGTSALANSLVLATNANSLSGTTHSTIISFEAAISSATTAGSYAKSITLTAAANP